MKQFSKILAIVILGGAMVLSGAGQLKQCKSGAIGAGGGAQ